MVIMNNKESGYVYIDIHQFLYKLSKELAKVHVLYSHRFIEKEYCYSYPSTCPND